MKEGVYVTKFNLEDKAFIIEINKIQHIKEGHRYDYLD